MEGISSAGSYSICGPLPKSSRKIASSQGFSEPWPFAFYPEAVSRPNLASFKLQHSSGPEGPSTRPESVQTLNEGYELRMREKGLDSWKLLSAHGPGAAVEKDMSDAQLWQAHHISCTLWPRMPDLDGRNRAIAIAESLARVIVAIRIACVRWS